MGCGGPVRACISQPEGRTETIMRLRSLNRVLRNINTEEGKKIQEDVFFSTGILRVLYLLNQGLLFFTITGLTAENVKFQRTAKHRPFSVVGWLLFKVVVMCMWEDC